MKTNLLNFDRQAMESFFIALGEKKFRGSQVLQWIHGHGVNDFSKMNNINQALREKLHDLAEIKYPNVVFDQSSKDGTRKWILQMDQGNQIETVFIPETNRGTLCISSQVGCALNCSFCSTGQQGYNRNLSTAEIIGQVCLARQLIQQKNEQSRPITNVVFMGMGEPLLNLEAVIGTVNILLDDQAYGLSRRRVTISTSGVVPGIIAMTGKLNVSLAISLHAANDDLRSQLVPINRKYKINELLNICKKYLNNEPRAKITFEYTMLQGVNDSIKQAKELVTLLQGYPGKLNLIPFNPFPNSDYKCSSMQTIQSFAKVLNQSGIVATIRKTRGDDIDAACGQLVGKVQARGNKIRRT